MKPDLLIIQNDRTKQTFLYSSADGGEKCVEASKGEFDVLKGLAMLIRSNLYDNQEIVDTIQRMAKDTGDLENE
jgi:hypothetical protein